MFEYVDRACTGPAAAQQSFINYFRGTPQTFCSDMTTSIQAVTAQDVLTVIRSHVLRLFDVTRTSMVAACNQSKALSLKFDLVRKFGRPMVESGTIERCFASMVSRCMCVFAYVYIIFLESTSFLCRHKNNLRRRIHLRPGAPVGLRPPII